MSNPLLPSNTHTHTAPSEILDFDAAVDANTDVNLNKLHREDITTNPHMTTAAQVGLGFVPNVKQNLTAIVPPVPGNDSSQGYAVGSRWIDTAAQLEYVCIDASVGAAVWVSRPTTVSPAGNPWEAIVMNQAASAPVRNPRVIIGALSGGVQNVSNISANNVALIGFPVITGTTTVSSGPQFAFMASDSATSTLIQTPNMWFAGKRGTNTGMSTGGTITGPTFTFRMSDQALSATYSHGTNGCINCSGIPNAIINSAFIAGFGGAGGLANNLAYVGNLNFTGGGSGAFSTGYIGRSDGTPSSGANTIQGSYGVQISNGFIMGGGARGSSNLTNSFNCRAAICSAIQNSNASQCGALFTHNGTLAGPSLNIGANSQAASFCTTTAPTASNQVNTNNVLWETQTILSDETTKTDIVPILPPENYAVWRDAFQSVQPKAFRMLEQSNVEPELRGFDAEELQAAFPLTVLDTSLDERRVRRNDEDTAWVDEAGQECDEAHVDILTGIYAFNTPRQFKTLDTTALLQTLLVTAQQQSIKLASLTALLA